MVFEYKQLTSTVGFPRESRISRALTDLMEDMFKEETDEIRFSAKVCIPTKAEVWLRRAANIRV
jgi:hypothetical protein